MFELGDYVVYPGHGVGQVIDRADKEVKGEVLSTISVKIVSNGMKMIVPQGKSPLRSLITEKEINDVFNLLQDKDVNPSRETWNRRHREYMAKINTGSVLEIADVLRSLLVLKYSKKLSFGEKKMVELCKDLLVKEIAITSGAPEKEVNHKIDSLYQ